MARQKSKPKPWSPHDVKVMRAMYAANSNADIAVVIGRTAQAVNSRAKVLGLKKARYLLTPADKKLVARLYKTTPAPEIAKKIGCSLGQVYYHAHFLGLRRDPDQLMRINRELGKRLAVHPNAVKHRIPKGNVPKNKGVRRPGFAVGRMADTQFKKGRKPNTWKAIGSEAYSKEGYLKRKMTDTGYPPRDWRAVHIFLWEQHHGAVPPRHRVCFKDGDKTHIAIENLELCTTADLMRRNTIHNLPKQLKEVIVLNANIKRRIRRIEREKQDQRSA